MDGYGRSPPARTYVEDLQPSRDNVTRQRSPNGDRYGRNGGRRRSRSPTQIDRYKPDRRHDGRQSFGRDRQRSFSMQKSNVDRNTMNDPRMPPRLPTHNRLRDPLLEPIQVGFNQYAEWWKLEQDIKIQHEHQVTGQRPESIHETREEQKTRIHKAYEEYKGLWNTRAAKAFVTAHRSEGWFQERYVTDVRDQIRVRIDERKKELYTVWDADLQAGIFDNFTLEGIHKSDSNGAGGMMDKEEGEAAANKEVLAVSDLIPSKGSDITDPIADRPALLIKSITPTATRSALEAFCSEKLGTGENGLQWLSLSDPNPHKRFHRLGWLVLNSSSAEVAHGSKREENDKDSVEVKPDAGSSKTPLDIALEAINGQSLSESTTGGFVLHVGIHRVSTFLRKKALWDLFSAPDRVQRDCELAQQLVNKLDERLGSLYRGVAAVEQRVSDLAGKGALQPPLSSAAPVDSPDVEDGEEVEHGTDNVDDEDMLITKKKLDLLVEYLRRVHNCCFYCVFEADSVHELQRKCAAGHLRRPRANLSAAAKEVARATAKRQPFPTLNEIEAEASPTDERKSRQARSQLQKAYHWVMTFEEKLSYWLDPGKVDLVKLGGQPIEDGLTKELDQYVKQEDASKFRCRVPDCAKLFKGPVFWRKHVEKRHVEWLESLKTELRVLNEYVLDPAKLAVGRTDTASNGHFPTPKDASNGAGRHHQSNMPPFVPGFNTGVGYPQGPPYSTGMPPPYAGRSGPMRNGMRMGGMRTAGPYERGPRRDGRPPYPMNGSGRAPPHFVEGGIGTFSMAAMPEGRTIKSYNDLDECGPIKESAALDY